MICLLCLNLPCNDGDSIGSRQGLCQDCWEAACSTEWWEAVAALQDASPIESLDVADSRCGGDRESVDAVPGL